MQASPSVEQRFLLEYRSVGATTAAAAFAVGAAAYAYFAVVSFAAGEDLSTILGHRWLPFLLFLILGISVTRWRSWVLERYSVVMGAMALFMLLALTLSGALFGSAAYKQVTAPSILLGLWALYGFIRLPIWLGLAIGTLASIASLWGPSLTDLPWPFARTLGYLCIANGMGILLAWSIERRERRLFLQRSLLEEAQAELQARTAAAEEASAEKTRLIAAVGHDLRQPMMAAVLHSSVLSEALAQGDLERAGRQCVQVDESIRVLGTTLDHLLTAARHQSGTEPLRVAAIDLRRVLVRLEHLFEIQAREAGLDLRIRVPAASVVVLSDEQVLVRILTNLVANGIKFARGRSDPRTGLVRGVVVNLRVGGGRCLVRVADNGIGIAPGDQAKVWEPFFQVDNQARDRRKGMGLGLYLIRQSISLLPDHALALRSRPGRGTRFTLSLPVGVGEPAPGPVDAEPSIRDPSAGEGPVGAPAAHGSAAQAALAGLYVLVIEDDPEAREALQRRLEGWGVLSCAAAGADEVLALHEGNDRMVDALLVDFRLPGPRDGVASIAHLSARLGYAPDAILMTAEEVLDPIRARLSAKTRLLRKPFEASALACHLRSALDAALATERAAGVADRNEGSDPHDQTQSVH